MEIPMKPLFQRCAQILSDRLVPMHYGELTDAAISTLGLSPSIEIKRKNRENVREKLLMANQYGTIYTGAPLYAGALQEWFVSDLQLMMPFGDIQIGGSVQAGIDGAFEALMRSPYMAVNSSGYADTEKKYRCGDYGSRPPDFAMQSLVKLYRGRASGLVVEKHVAQWFKRQYPSFYDGPSNKTKYWMACNHDFRLNVNGRQYEIDVAGPDSKGNYGKRGNKRAAHFHLNCRAIGDACVIEEVIRGEHYKEHIDPQHIFSPRAFVVWLNCAKHGIDYRSAAPSMEHAA